MAAKVTSMTVRADKALNSMYAQDHFGAIGGVVTDNGRTARSRRGSAATGGLTGTQILTRGWVQFASNIVLPLSVAICSAIAAVEHSYARVYWSIGSIFSLFLIGLIGYSKDRAASAITNEYIRSKTNVATALNDAGKPLVVAVGDVTSANNLAQASANLMVLVDRAVSLAQVELARSSKSRTRAALYCLEGDRLKRKSYQSWIGVSAPRTEFVPGRSEHDDEVLRFAQGENTLLVDDLENDPPPHFSDNKGRVYKSFVSVPVRAATKSFGLLTADSDTAHALSGVELGHLVLIAGVLAAGMAHVETLKSKGRPNPGRPKVQAS